MTASGTRHRGTAFRKPIAAWCGVAALVALSVLAPVPAPAASGNRPPEPTRSAPAPDAAVAAPAGPGEESHVLVVRPGRIDLQVDGTVVRSVVRPVGTMSLGTLARLVADGDWISARRGTVILRASVEQAPGTSMVAGGPTVDTVLLAGSRGSGAWMRGSNARLSLRGVRVLGWDERVSKQAALTRTGSYLFYGNASRVLVEDSSFGGLGRAGASGGEDTSGVALSRSRATISGSAFSGNAVGLSLINPFRATLSDVRVLGSSGSGLVLKAPEETSVAGLLSRGNSGDGLQIRGGGSGLTLTGAQLLANGGDGARLDRLTQSRFRDLSTSGNKGAGVSVKSGREITLNGLKSVADGEGVAVTGTSSNVTVDGGRVTKARTGLSTGIGTSSIRITSLSFSDIRLSAAALAGTGISIGDSTVTNARIGLDLSRTAQAVTAARLAMDRVETGVVANGQTRRIDLRELRVRRANVAVAVAASDLTVGGGRISDTKVGVRIYGAARAARLSDLRLEDVGAGIIATNGTRAVVLQRVTVSQRTGIGVSSTSPGLVIRGGTISGGLLGLDLDGSSVRVDGTVISGARDGIRMGPGGGLTVTGARVDVTGTALRAGDQASVRVVDSRLWGAEATGGAGTVDLVGANDIPPLPLPWYGLAAIVAATSAAVLEVMRRLREYEPEWAGTAAAHITNRS